ncbi:hypothetical protein KSS87_013811 [Heliosperma pusillum]|nr:hypothetical protein KSS87_013811 [Heliosperma pusillum]
MVDLFGNVPDIVIDKIIEKLPIRMAAQTSVLSKPWRRAWLSLKSLVFKSDFWGQQTSSDWRQHSQIISDILLYHNGPIHDFCLYIPSDASDAGLNPSRWISFLSNNGVRKIGMINSYGKTDSTYIFRCSELVDLYLTGFKLNPPPTDFRGFPNLKHLVLLNIVFIEQNFFNSLIENCRKLETIELGCWSGLDHIVIDAPNLQTLVLLANFESLGFRNVQSLKSVSIHLITRPEKLITVETVNAVNFLASSCQLQSIEFKGDMCKFLSGGGIIRSTSVTFKHLDKLCLSYLNLNDSGVFHYILSMIECCPYIKTFEFSVYSCKNVGQNIVGFNHNYKLDHLRKITIKGITGSSEELKLVEYLLAISGSLDNLFFKAGSLSTDSELKMSRALMRFPRASTKASIICLDT